MLLRTHDATHTGACGEICLGHSSRLIFRVPVPATPSADQGGPLRNFSTSHNLLTPNCRLFVALSLRQSSICNPFMQIDVYHEVQRILMDLPNRLSTCHCQLLVTLTSVLIPPCPCLCNPLCRLVRTVRCSASSPPELLANSLFATVFADWCRP